MTPYNEVVKKMSRKEEKGIASYFSRKETIPSRESNLSRGKTNKFNMNMEKYFTIFSSLLFCAPPPPPIPIPAYAINRGHALKKNFSKFTLDIFIFKFSIICSLKIPPFIGRNLQLRLHPRLKKQSLAASKSHNKILSPSVNLVKQDYSSTPSER